MAIKRKRSRSMSRNASRKRSRYTRGKRYRARRNRRYVRSLLRYTETKFHDLNTSHDVGHNGGQSPGSPVAYVQDYNMLQTVQGQTQFTRIGDKVWGKGLKIKMWISNKSDRCNVIYRIFAVCLPHDQLNALPANFWSGSYGGNYLLEMINTDRYKVLYNKMITIHTTSKWTVDTNPALNREKEISRYHSFYIPLNRMISYAADGGNVPKYQRDILGIGVVAYDAFGTLQTDIIGSYRLKSRFYFKDP